MLKHHPSLLLASKSPRRQELLKAAGIEFTMIDVDVEEVYPDDMELENVPEFAFTFSKCLHRQCPVKRITYTSLKLFSTQFSFNQIIHSTRFHCFSVH